MEVLRHTDLGKMHADLPMGEQTMRLVCNGRAQRTLERTLEGRPARDPAPGVFFFFFFFFCFFF